MNYEIIEKYINGELTSQEQTDFDNQLKIDEGLAQEVALYKEVNQSLENKYTHLEKENALKNTLGNLKTKHFNNSENIESTKVTKSINIRKYFISFSSIAAILVIGFFLLKPQTSLYNQFAEHSSLEIQVKGETEESLLKASNFYNNKEYVKAIPLLEEYLRLDPEDVEVQFSLGIALLESDMNEDALLIFDHIYKEDNVFKNKAAWYIALVNLKTDQPATAKVYLESITENTFYFNKAQKLKSKL